MRIEVVNINRTKKYNTKNFFKNGVLYIYCGRPRPLSNPYKIGVDGDRDEVIERHKNLLRKDGSKLKETFSNLIDFIKEKRPQKVVLGCYCKPAKCHCDTYKKELDCIYDRKLF